MYNESDLFLNEVHVDSVHHIKVFLMKLACWQICLSAADPGFPVGGAPTS